MRVSAHPDHYTLLNSPKPEVLAASLTDLDYHARMLVAMGLPPSPSLVLHVGGQYREKAAALRRFADRLRRAARPAGRQTDGGERRQDFHRRRGAGPVRGAGAPDGARIHHHRVNGGGDLGELWPRIAATWGDGTPKVHVSSPKDDRDRRAHADYVDPADVLPFLRLARETGRDRDVMVEAKMKDEAMFRLVEELAAEPGVRRAGQAAVEL
jgi:UV DNA damage endonuclease